MLVVLRWWCCAGGATLVVLCWWCYAGGLVSLESSKLFSSVCLYVCLTVCPYSCPSIGLFVRPSPVFLSVRLSVCPKKKQNKVIDK